MKWEYLTISCSAHELEETLNKYGESEWELINTVVVISSYALIFKREKFSPWVVTGPG